MTKRLLLIWLVLLIAPLIPVTALYVIFDQANYFKLEDAARGIVATGPIAAYVALVWIGWQIYRRVSNITVTSSAALKQVVGDWTFEAESAHHTKRNGRCTITNPGGVLTITGSFIEEGKPVGDWRSQMAQLTDNELSVVYTLTELRDDNPVSSKGVCTLHFNPASVSPMTGVWAVVGVAEANGTITYTKVS
jgi:hypothetical protein